MIRVAICDDENVVVSQIENILFDICKHENIKVEIDGFYSGKELEKEILNGTVYDLLYLDIYMDNGDGIAVAKKIRETDDNTLIIYVSAYENYLIELFRLDVFAFVKKPIEADEFANIFLDANKRICSRKYYFAYHYKNEEHKILCNDILYFESSGRKTIIHTKSGEKQSFNGKLSDTEKQLSGGKIPFLRIHQSYLVNYHCIKSRSKSEVTVLDGTVLPISEDRKKEFGRQYGQLLGGEINV